MKKERIADLVNNIKLSTVQPVESGGRIIYFKKLPFSVFYTCIAALFITLFSFYDNFTYLNVDFSPSDKFTIGTWGIYAIILFISILLGILLVPPKYINKTLFIVIPIVFFFFVIEFILSLFLINSVFLHVTTISLFAVTNGLLFISIFEMILYTLSGYQRLTWFAMFCIGLIGLVFLNVVTQDFAPSFCKFAIPLFIIILMYYSMFIMDKTVYARLVLNNEKTITSTIIFSLIVTGILFFNMFTFIVYRSKDHLDIAIFNNDSLFFYVGMLSATVVSFFIYRKNRYSSIIFLLIWWSVALINYQLGTLYIVNPTNNAYIMIFVKIMMGYEMAMAAVTFLSFVGRLLEESSSAIVLRFYILITVWYISLLIIASNLLSTDNIINIMLLCQSMLFGVGVAFIVFLVIGLSSQKSVVTNQVVVEVEKETAVKEAEVEMSPVLRELKNTTIYPNPATLLTKKELLVFEQLIKGYTLRQVAGELRMKYDTVNFHYKNIYRKLEVNSRIELIMRYSLKV